MSFSDWPAPPFHKPKHTRKQARTHTHAHACKHSHAHSHMPIHTRTCIHALTHENTCTPTCTRTQTHTPAHAQVHTCTQTHKQIHTQTHTHPHTHTRAAHQIFIVETGENGGDVGYSPVSSWSGSQCCYSSDPLPHGVRWLLDRRSEAAGRAWEAALQRYCTTHISVDCCWLTAFV